MPACRWAQLGNLNDCNRCPYTGKQKRHIGLNSSQVKKYAHTCTHGYTVRRIVQRCKYKKTKLDRWTVFLIYIYSFLKE